MSITGDCTGTGAGTVTVSLAPNSNPAERTATLTIAGQSVSVRQEGLGSCTIDILPGSASFSKDGATGTFAVTAAEHCQWSASSNAA